jgi:negative modulator of initiation of replication
MKTIEVDEELYRYIASHTQHIGESASDILRRMLKFTAGQSAPVKTTPVVAGSPAVAENAEQNKAVSRFMLILSTLYRLDPKAFADATASLQGRTRVYFAGDQQTLLQHGTHTKPKHVPGTPYWVITNTNTGRKGSMIEHIMQSMQFPQELTDKVCGTI